MSLDNPTSFKTAQGDGFVEADGFWSPTNVNTIVDTVTLAQLNAGKTLIAGIRGKTIKVLGYLLSFNGSFTGATDIRLQDSNGTPVVVTTVAIAGATAGAKISSEATDANTTDGAGLFANLTKGEGLRIVKTGSAAAGGTNILVKVLYIIS